MRLPRSYKEWILQISIPRKEHSFSPPSTQAIFYFQSCEDCPKKTKEQKILYQPCHFIDKETKITLGCDGHLMFFPAQNPFPLLVTTYYHGIFFGTLPESWSFCLEWADLIPNSRGGHRPGTDKQGHIKVFTDSHEMDSELI